MSTGTRIPTFEWTFGKRLEAARKLAGLSQDQMAQELSKRGFKVKHAAVNRWEKNQTQPRNLFDLIDAYSEITDVDSRWLLMGPDAWAATGSNREPAEEMPELPFAFADAA